MPEDLTGIFGKPFAEQVAALRLRVADLRPTARWDDLVGAEHDRAFMVAGAVKADLLADLAAAVDRVVAEGGSLEEFRRDFRAIVERNGWHGWTGEGTKKGEAWRTRVIYRTNVATTYAAGRMAQLREADFPFWVYKHSGAEHPRLDHLSWDGLVLKKDHDFWKKHYPPNGWGCGCRVAGARSKRGAARLGGNPDKPLPPGWDKTDPKTGAPPGIGKGWDHAPGDSVSDTIATMTGKTVAWPYEIAKAYMRDLPEAIVDRFAQGYRQLPSVADAARRYAERALGSQAGAPRPGIEPYLTLGLLSRDEAARARDILGAEVELFDYTVSEFAVRHVQNEHGDPVAERGRGQRAVVAADYALLPQLLQQPDSVMSDRGDLVIEKRIGQERYRAIFKRLAKRRMLTLVTFWIVG